MANKKFYVNAGRKDFFGSPAKPPAPSVADKKEAKTLVADTRTSIYLDQARRDWVKGYVLWKRGNGSPMYTVKNFYSEMIDRMGKENPSVTPYGGDLI
jgi:hypothetical protein